MGDSFAISPKFVNFHIKIFIVKKKLFYAGISFLELGHQYLNDIFD